jgi:outer membrane protein assembly factor BamB
MLMGFAGQFQQNAELVCHEMGSGKEMWRTDLGGKFQRGSLLKTGDNLLCLGENGDLGFLDVEPTEVKLTSHTKLFHAPETWTLPAVSNGRLYVCQNQPGSGKKPRVICYDFRAKQQ